MPASVCATIYMCAYRYYACANTCMCACRDYACVNIGMCACRDAYKWKHLRICESCTHVGAFAYVYVGTCVCACKRNPFGVNSVYKNVRNSSMDRILRISLKEMQHLNIIVILYSTFSSNDDT